MQESWLAAISAIGGPNGPGDLQSFWGAFLSCDLNQAGGGSLPTGMKGWHKQKLTGRHIVQVDEVVNTALPIRKRHSQNVKGRCLKMALTDASAFQPCASGKQEAEALEYRHLPDVGPDMPAGFKMALTDVEVRRGLLLLQPENTQILGGCVERLEQARQRSLASLRKPAEGRGGNRNSQPLHPAAAASAAAWPSELQPAPAPSGNLIQGASDAARGLASQLRPLHGQAAGHGPQGLQSSGRQEHGQGASAAAIQRPRPISAASLFPGGLSNAAPGADLPEADATGSDEEMEEADSPMPSRNRRWPAAGHPTGQPQPQPHSPPAAQQAGNHRQQAAEHTPGEIIVLEDDPTPTPGARHPSADQGRTTVPAQRQRQLLLSSDDEDDDDAGPDAHGADGDETHDDTPARGQGPDNAGFPAEPADHQDDDYGSAHGADGHDSGRHGAMWTGHPADEDEMHHDGHPLPRYGDAGANPEPDDDQAMYDDYEGPPWDPTDQGDAYGDAYDGPAGVPAEEGPDQGPGRLGGPFHGDAYGRGSWDGAAASHHRAPEADASSHHAYEGPSDEHGCAMADDYEGPPSEPADQYHSSGHDHEAGQESPKQGEGGGGEACWPMTGIKLSGRIKKPTSTIVWPEHETSEHEAFFVGVMLELDCAQELQPAKLGALPLQDILGLTSREAAAMFQQDMDAFIARVERLKRFMKSWKGGMELQQEAPDMDPVITKLL
ncbi:hypothetical protein WJX84_002427 [Apatococcus fuscideae]|uniref:RecQ-mediated genome instability protein 1 n=1 Tax=Apatococcus fuscideae TaxID=2026836 RepID=A0AAW1TG65_9CHLO